MTDTLGLAFVGDLILDEPEPDRFFASTADVLRTADVTIGHVEVPHTDRGEQPDASLPAPPARPDHLSALSKAGFDVTSLAGNHVFDAGTTGVLDTRQHLRDLGIATAGSGRDLAEAREPAIVDRDGRRVALLSYNCVGPKESWASARKAGGAYLEIITHYELDHATPGGPPTIYTFPTTGSVQRLRDDIAEVVDQVDVLVVAFHKGIGHVPAELAQYERTVAHEAIDAGADVVVGHHAHILRGIEFHRGRPIFHGLGNFVTVTRALTPDDGNDSEERRAWAVRREKLFGFRPDPQMPTYPFHPESRNTLIATCEVASDGQIRAGFVPCYIDGDGQPEVSGDDERGRAVVDYVNAITIEAGLDPLEFTWAGQRVEVRPTA